MKNLLLFCITLISLSTNLFAGEAAGTDANPAGVTELFSTEKEPGEGQLEYTNNGLAEKISLGLESGQYGLGLLFHSSVLPKTVQKELNNAWILQVALGTLKSKTKENTPQFGALSLLSEKMPSVTTVFDLAVPTGKPNSAKNSGTVLFTSPSTKLTQTETEILQNNFFSKSGKATLTPIGKVQRVQVKHQGTTLTFKKQLMKLEIAANLATPFSSPENKLSGSIQIPFYWPFGKEANELTQKIATGTMGTKPTNSLKRTLSSPQKSEK